MYESFFGFKEKPFDITPDPRFLYLSKKHREALAHLIYGVKQRKGFVVLSGEVGTGKTTLVRALLERLDKTYQIAYVFNPDLSVEEFFKFVSYDFGLHVNGGSKIDYLMKLHDFLLESHLDERTAALIIDEAQCLEASLFKEVRMLTNLETSKRKLLQVLLVGQPELNDLLERPEFRHLKQRISIRYHLLPLERHETREYIETRMRIAGAKSQNCFTEGALQKIHDYSGGVPRLINTISDNALVTAFATDKPVINEQIIRECAGDLRLEKVQKKTPRIQGKAEETAPRSKVSLAALLLVALIAFAVFGTVFFSDQVNVGQITSKPLETVRSIFERVKQYVVLGDGVIEPQEADQTEGFSEPQIDSKAAPAVGVSIDEPDPVTDPHPELDQKMEGTDAFQTSEGEPRTRVVIAGPRENVTAILFREFGRVDTHLLEATKRLNPGIEDMNRIKAGQEIQLPLNPEEAYSGLDSTSYFAVHIASFRDFHEAQKLVEDLIESGARPSIAGAKLHKEGPWYRVTIGEYQSFSEASLEAQRLEESGQFPYAKPIKLNDFGDGKVKRVVLE